MLIILPIRTNIKSIRTPYANYGLIALNVLIFALYSPWGMPKVFGPWVDTFSLVPLQPRIWQFVTYAFLHANLWHILGNMFFLYLFGNSVNDKLGHIGYLCFYLAGAVFSGIGHVLITDYSVLGASGAVAAVTGAYLVLFPQTLITVFYWLIFYIDTIEIPALGFIGFKLIVWDNIIERNIPGIAHGADLSGYAFGILTMLCLLSVGIISHSGFDLWSMLRQWNRRRAYRDAVAGGYDPFTAQDYWSKKVIAKEVKKTETELRRDEEIARVRGEIAASIAQHNLALAADGYLRLMELDREQILPRQHLLDIANQLASQGRQQEAAMAYESFLVHYAKYEYRDQVELMLGLLYSRYLNKPDLAVKYLQSAAQKLSNQAQLKMCRDELSRLGK